MALLNMSPCIIGAGVIILAGIAAWTLVARSATFGTSFEVASHTEVDIRKQIFTRIAILMCGKIVRGFFHSM